MCLESTTENRQTVFFNDWGWKIVPDGWYGWTKCAAAICSSGAWYLEQRTSWWAQCHRWTRALTGDQLIKLFRLWSRLCLESQSCQLIRWDIGSQCNDFSRGCALSNLTRLPLLQHDASEIEVKCEIEASRPTGRIADMQSGYNTYDPFNGRWCNKTIHWAYKSCNSSHTSCSIQRHSGLLDVQFGSRRLFNVSLGSVPPRGSRSAVTPTASVISVND